MFTFSYRMSPLTAIALGGCILLTVTASSKGDDAASATGATAAAVAPAAVTNTLPAPVADTNTVAAPAPHIPVVPAVEPVAPERAPAVPEKTQGFLSGHLEIGAGMGSYSLSDNKGNGRFLGSIDELEAESDSFVFPVVGLYLNRFIGLECRYEQYEARMYTDTADDHSDGTVKVSGPVASIVGRLPLDTVTGLFSSSESVRKWASHVVPFAGVGTTFFDESIDAEPWWAHGFDSQEVYEAAGSPSRNRNGYFRSFKMSEQQATIILVGASILLGDSLSLNAAWTQAEMDFDSSFYLAGQLGGEGTIPFHYSTTSIDLRYRF